MKALTKIALVTTGLLSMGALTACQSTQAPQTDKNAQSMVHGKHHHKMSPEKREKMQKMREQRKAVHEQMQKACDGQAVGYTTQIKVGDKAIDGTCQLVFKADHKAMKEMKQHAQHHHKSHSKMKEMTEQQRAELKQKFEQKRTERKAQWQALQQACAEQSNGKTIQVKLGEKIIDGQCVIKFQPQKPVKQQPVATNQVAQPTAATTATPAA